MDRNNRFIEDWNALSAIGPTITTPFTSVTSFTLGDVQFGSSSSKVVPDGAKTVMRREGKFLVSDVCENGKINVTYALMPDIVDVSVIESNGINKVVIVKFADDTTQKAVLSDDDTWSSSLEQGISICITKKLLDMRAGNGSSLYNKIVNRGVKIYNKSQKEKEQKAKEAAEQKARAEKAAEKRSRKKQKREAAIRENQIEIQKEAYLRAMREHDASGC